MHPYRKDHIDTFKYCFEKKMLPCFYYLIMYWSLQTNPKINEFQDFSFFWGYHPFEARRSPRNNDISHSKMNVSKTDSIDVCFMLMTAWLYLVLRSLKLVVWEMFHRSTVNWAGKGWTRRSPRLSLAHRRLIKWVIKIYEGKGPFK